MTVSTFATCVRFASLLEAVLTISAAELTAKSTGNAQRQLLLSDLESLPVGVFVFPTGGFVEDFDDDVLSGEAREVDFLVEPSFFGGICINH